MGVYYEEFVRTEKVEGGFLLYSEPINHSQIPRAKEI